MSKSCKVQRYVVVSTTKNEEVLFARREQHRYMWSSFPTVFTSKSDAEKVLAELATAEALTEIIPLSFPCPHHNWRIEEVHDMDPTFMSVNCDVSCSRCKRTVLSVDLDIDVDAATIEEELENA